MKTIQCAHPPHHHNGFVATCQLWTPSGGVHALFIQRIIQEFNLGIGFHGSITLWPELCSWGIFWGEEGEERMGTLSPPPLFCYISLFGYIYYWLYILFFKTIIFFLKFNFLASYSSLFLKSNLTIFPHFHILGLSPN